MGTDHQVEEGSSVHVLRGKAAAVRVALRTVGGHLSSRMASPPVPMAAHTLRYILNNREQHPSPTYNEPDLRHGPRIMVSARGHALHVQRIIPGRKGRYLGHGRFQPAPTKFLWSEKDTGRVAGRWLGAMERHARKIA